MEEECPLFTEFSEEELFGEPQVICNLPISPPVELPTPTQNVKKPRKRKAHSSPKSIVREKMKVNLCRQTVAAAASTEESSSTRDPRITTLLNIVDQQQALLHDIAALMAAAMPTDNRTVLQAVFRVQRASVALLARAVAGLPSAK